MKRRNNNRSTTATATSSSSSAPRLTYCVLIVVSVLCGYVLSSSNLFLRRYYKATLMAEEGRDGQSMNAPHQSNSNKMITLSASISAEISNSGSTTSSSGSTSSLRGSSSSKAKEDDGEEEEEEEEQPLSDEPSVVVAKEAVATTTPTKEESDDDDDVTADSENRKEENKEEQEKPSFISTSTVARLAKEETVVVRTMNETSKAEQAVVVASHSMDDVEVEASSTREDDNEATATNKEPVVTAMSNSMDDLEVVEASTQEEDEAATDNEQSSAVTHEDKSSSTSSTTTTTTYRPPSVGDKVKRAEDGVLRVVVDDEEPASSNKNETVDDVVDDVASEEDDVTATSTTTTNATAMVTADESSNNNNDTTTTPKVTTATTTLNNNNNNNSAVPTANETTTTTTSNNETATTFNNTTISNNTTTNPSNETDRVREFDIPTTVDTPTGALRSYNYDVNATGLAKECQDFASQKVTFDTQGYQRRNFTKTQCGALWNGDSLNPTFDNLKYTSTSTDDNNDKTTHIHVVVAYCHNPLDWMVEQLKELVELGGTNANATSATMTTIPNIKLTMDVYSKCGKEHLVEGFFADALRRDDDDNDNFIIDSLNVQTLPNVGGCDHTYAYWMKNNARTSPAHYVFFLKDTKRDDSLLSVNGRYRPTSDMLRVASHRGFACGLDTNALDNVPKRTGFVNSVTSVYHDTKRLYRYKMKMDTYQRASVREGLYNETNETLRAQDDDQQQQQDQANNTTDANFASTQYKQMGPFVVKALTNKTDDLCKRLPICNHEEYTFVQVCYGGTFAVDIDQILKVDEVLFERLVTILSRGNNIEEGHYVERSWAGILAPPITPEERLALLTFSNAKVTEMPGVFGAMARTWVGRHPRDVSKAPKMGRIWRPVVQ